MKIQAADITGQHLEKGNKVTFHHSSGLHGTGVIVQVWSNGTISVKEIISGLTRKLAGSLVTKQW